MSIIKYDGDNFYYSDLARILNLTTRQISNIATELCYLSPNYQIKKDGNKNIISIEFANDLIKYNKGKDFLDRILRKQGNMYIYYLYNDEKEDNISNFRELLNEELKIKFDKVVKTYEKELKEKDEQYLEIMSKSLQHYYEKEHIKKDIEEYRKIINLLKYYINDLREELDKSGKLELDPKYKLTYEDLLKSFE